MPAGHVTAFYLFDIGDAIDLKRVSALIDASTTTRLSTRPPSPIYLQYQQPPVVIEAAAIGAGEVEGFRARFKAFDYGVVSVALSRALPESWDELLAAALRWHDNAALASGAERLCRELL